MRSDSAPLFWLIRRVLSPNATGHYCRAEVQTKSPVGFDSTATPGRKDGPGWMQLPSSLLNSSFPYFMHFMGSFAVN